MNSFNTVLDFGKHKGKTINEVLLLEPQYVGWLIYDTNIFNFTFEEYDFVFKLIYDKYPSFYSNDRVVAWIQNNSNNNIVIIMDKYVRQLEIKIQNAVNNRRNFSL